jgi:hypothetical protein
VHPTEMTHPSEATLLAVAQGQPPVEDAVQILTHLRACEPCEVRVFELIRQEREIAALLAELDHPMPARSVTEIFRKGRAREVRRGILAAGIATLCAVGAAAAALPASPVHQWIRRRLLSPEARQAPAPRPARPAAAAPDAAAGISLPAPMTLAVVLRQPQTSGVVDITLVDGGEITLRSRGGSVAYGLETGRIVVENRLPALEYDVEVPVGMERFTLRVNDRIVFEKDGDQVRAARPADRARHYRLSLHEQTR